MRVMTVNGPVAPEELGLTLPHEHIFLDLRHSPHGMNAIFNDLDLAIDELRYFKDAGGGTVVDITNGTMGRDVEALKTVSEETGLHIVAATGYYTEPYYPSHVYELTTNKIADLMVKELTEGIAETGIKAGIIGEIGTRRDFINPVEERVFRAVARAHLRTGAPISTHTYLEQLTAEQIEIFQDEGVDLHHLIIGHLGDQRNMERFRAVADAGAYVQIDHSGLEIFQRDVVRAKTVAQLVREGYLSQILLSMDICFKSRLHYYGGTGYDHLLKVFVPLLEAEGVTNPEINTMLVENPRRALAYDI